jgi:hypothetical protein
MFIKESKDYSGTASSDGLDDREDAIELVCDCRNRILENRLFGFVRVKIAVFGKIKIFNLFPELRPIWSTHVS